MNRKALILGSLGIACGFLVFSLFYKTPATSEFPELAPVLEKFSAPGMEHADPVNCIDCHREIIEAWEGSHHALANAPVTDVDRARLESDEDSLLAARQMEWKSKPDTPVLLEAGVAPHPVVGSIGITPLIQYLHLASDGRIQAHDVAWDVGKEEWFSVFEVDDEDESPRFAGEWGHWTGQGMNWDANCAYCHMTEYKKNYDPVADRYNRDWSHMAITCAQCHPGMETHMSQVRNGNNDFKEELTARQHMENCAACHSRRDELTPHDFVAGNHYEDHFQLALADMDGLYHPDGQVIGENYVYGSLTMSKMGHAGVTCLDCHNPHTAGFILPVENNALCQRCHGSGLQDAPKIDPIKHSRHKGDSIGNRCVECHMPSTEFMGRDPRRDHSFSHPDPRLTLEMGIPNACSKCHNTQSIEWSLDYAEKWFGPDMNADRRKKARLMRAVWDGKEDAPARLKEAVTSEANRYWKSTFISMFQYIPGDFEAYEILSGFLDHEDPMIRSAAVRIVGTDNLDPTKQQALLNDPIRSVRLGAAISSPRMDGLSTQGEAELKAYLEHTSDSPMGALRLSSYLYNRGDPEQAQELARRAVQFDQYNPEAYRLAAIQLHSSGDTDGALKLLNAALKLDSAQALVHFNLGLLKAELGDMEAAIRHLNDALKSAPQFEDAWYNLIVLYWKIDQLSVAREKLVEALTAMPQSGRLHELAGQMPPGN